MFNLEKEHLRPILRSFSATNTEHNNDISSISRVVRKDNTILYKANRYSVPLGTFSPYGMEVHLYIKENQLTIIHQETGELLGKHQISNSRGKLIQDRTHTRDRSKGIDAFITTVSEKFKDSSKAFIYLSEIRKVFPRYMRDQLQMISKQCEQNNEHVLQEALNACLGMKLFSAGEFKDMIEHVKRERLIPKQSSTHHDHIVQPIQSDQLDILRAKPSQRNVNDYLTILEGN